MHAILIVIIYAVVIQVAAAQVVVTAHVVDDANDEPLPFCHVAIAGEPGGTVTNADGAFQLDVQSSNDKLVFSYLGYRSLEMSTQQVLESKIVRLEQTPEMLGELTIYADGGYLYELVANCSSKMRASTMTESRAYFQLETSAQDKPLEMLEAYYNASFESGNLNNLQLKNGRAGLPVFSDRYFFSLDASKAIILLDLFSANPSYPANPLHFRKNRMQKKYDLVPAAVTSDESIVHLRFSPKIDQHEHFKGEMWIDKNSFDLLRIELEIDSASVHPLNTVGVADRIERIDFRISKSFVKEKDDCLPGVTLFDYDIRIYHPRNSYHEEQWILTTSTVLYPYDFGHGFVLPKFEYQADHSDYRKISFLPYDEQFWQHRDAIVLTTEQEQKLEFFEEEGVLLNFKEDFDNGGFFEKSNVIWSDSTRIAFKKSQSANAPELAEFQADRVNIHVQLFMDMNDYGNGLEFKTAAVFDIFESYNYIGETDLRSCYANIYFDLCEIARRQLQADLESNSSSVQVANKIYSRHLTELEQQLAVYNKDVQQGVNFEALQYWNGVVAGQLGIDNIALFKLAVPSD